MSSYIKYLPDLINKPLYYSCPRCDRSGLASDYEERCACGLSIMTQLLNPIVSVMVGRYLVQFQDNQTLVYWYNHPQMREPQMREVMTLPKVRWKITAEEIEKLLLLR